MANTARIVVLAIGLSTAGLAASRSLSAEDSPTPYAAALADIRATFGTVPSFLSRYPSVALPGAWQAMKALESGDTALPLKTKELIGLAVAAQIPCSYCIWAHTSSAKAAGATEEEIQEAVAMAALTRHWSTVAQGLQIDLDSFKRELAGAPAPGK